MQRWKIVLAAVVLFLAFVAYQAYDVFYGGNTFATGSPQTVFVSKGMTFPAIVDTLEAKGMIRSRPLFVFVAKVLGGTNRIQTGKYVFGSGISNADLYRSIRDGKGIELISVTIPEGLRARGQARILARTLGIDSAAYVNLVHDDSFARDLGIEARSLEGYLLPETYHFYWQPDEKEVIRRLVAQFKAVYTDSLEVRAKELGWTMNQVMTLASIVEGEAVLAEERDRISGVYHNRLRKGMRLEADPTIQFMIEDGPRRVLYSDLKVDHPYNTYRIKGLPPGPVNNPGKGAIHAALFPERHSYYFFVANGTGGHWFATTYSDHMRYVRMYRKNRQKNAAQSLSGGGGSGSTTGQ